MASNSPSFSIDTPLPLAQLKEECVPDPAACLPSAQEILSELREDLDGTDEHLVQKVGTHPLTSAVTNRLPAGKGIPRAGKECGRKKRTEGQFRRLALRDCP